MHFTNDLRIGEGVEVTIAPGSIFKLPYGAQLEVDGSLQAIGTLTEPIVFTATSDDTIGGDTNSDAEEIDVVPGSWNAIWLDSSDSVLDHVQIRYAGNQSNPGNNSWRTSALHIRNAASPTIRNSQVVHAENTGVYVASGSPQFQGLHVEGAGREAIYAELEANPLYVDVSAKDNVFDRVTLNTNNETLAADRTWDFAGLPVHFTNDLRIGEDATLTVQAGTVVKLPHGAHLEVDGSLKALGSQEMPIIFTSTTDDTIGGDSNGDAGISTGVPGGWNAIWLDSSDSVLDHVEIRFAGNQSNPGNNSWRTSALHVRGDVAPTIRNTEVLDAENVGVYIGDGSPTLENVHVERAGLEALYSELEASPTYENLSAEDNRYDRVTLNTAGKTLTENRTWDFSGLPVHLTNDLKIAEETTVTAVPGTVVKMPHGARLEIDGTLIAIGTQSQPITLTAMTDDTVGGDSNGDGIASTPVPGSWDSIWLNSSSSQFDHVEIRYAGNQSNPGNNSWRTSTLHVRAEDVELSHLTLLEAENNAIEVLNGGHLTLNDSLVVSSGGTGLHVNSGSATVEDTGFFGGQYGVWLDAGEAATVGNSAFDNISVEAVHHAGLEFDKANFQNNWWGDPDGPFDNSAIDGVVNNSPDGQSVSDYVDYDNWKTTQPSLPFGLAIVGVTVLDPVVHHYYSANGTTEDASAEHHGALVGGATYADGREGLAFSLDGVDDYVDLGQWTPGTNWTTAAWIKPSSLPEHRNTIVGGAGRWPRLGNRSFGSRADHCTDSRSKRRTGGTRFWSPAIPF